MKDTGKDQDGFVRATRPCAARSHLFRLKQNGGLQPPPPRPRQLHRSSFMKIREREARSRKYAKREWRETLNSVSPEIRYGNQLEEGRFLARQFNLEILHA
jgi:hypothetical protein